MAERELLFSVTKKDFKVTYYRGSGAGGQKRNKTDSGVRIQHPDSGAMAECCETPSQHQNKTTAFNRLVTSDKFQLWLRKAQAEALLTATQKEARERAIERAVDRQMHPDNIRIETYDPHDNA